MKRIFTNTVKRLLPYSLRIKLRKLNWKRKYYALVIFNKNSGKVYCPIAEREFKCFIPKKESIWESLLTVSTGAKNRHRLIWLYLKNETDLLKENSTLLHIAPEYCFLEKFKSINGIQYIPGDKMVTGYGKQDNVVYTDLLDLKQENESVDYILCNHVLEHIPDDRTAMKEMFRVLRKKGTAVVTVPIDETLKSTYEDFSIISPEEREKHFGQWDHVRYYGLDIKDRFESVGFNVQIIRYGDEFSAEEYKKFGLCDDLIIIAARL